MAERKESDMEQREPYLEVSEDKMFDSRLQGDYELHDRVHTPTHREEEKVKSLCIK